MLGQLYASSILRMREEQPRALLEPPAASDGLCWGWTLSTSPASSSSSRPISACRSFPKLKELEYWFGWLCLFFFFFLLQILFWVCSLSIPSFPASYSSLSLPPTPRLSELVSDAASPAALAANLPASQPAFGAHRLQSCVLRLPVASSQGWIKISF